MNSESKNRDIILFIMGCIIINLIGKEVAMHLQLPFWLDSVGTILAAYVLGPGCAAIIGASLNIMYGAFAPTAYMYVLTSVITGIVVGICARRNMFKSIFKTITISMILSLCTTFLSVPVNCIFFEGMTNNIWGDGIINYLKEIGIAKPVCIMAGQFCLDLLDKLVSVIIVFFIFYIYKKNKNNKNNKEKNQNSTSIITGIILLSICSLLIGNTSLAKEKEGDEQFNQGSSEYDTYIQTIYNKNNGVPGGGVNDIAQTRDGMLWLGTYSGLYQYDGNKFELMSNFDSVRNANCLYTDEEGRLWIGTNDSGISVCANNEIVNIVDTSDGLPADSVRSIIHGTDGLYYVGTSDALCMIMLSDGMKVVNVIDELNYVYSLATTQGGYVCAVTSSGKLALIAEQKIVDSFEVSKSGAEYTSVFFDAEGTLYASTTSADIEKYVIENNRLKKIGVIDSKGLADINSMYMTEKGVLFVCADNGIGHLDIAGNMRVVNTNGFTNNINSMLVDYQGNMWFASTRLGLLELTEAITRELFVQTGLEPEVVNAVVYWNGKYYFGTDAGLMAADKSFSRKLSVPLVDNIDEMRIRCLYVDSKDNMWVATSGNGVYKFSVNGKVIKLDKTDGLIEDKTRNIIELKDGSIVIGTDNGISFIKNDKVVASLDEQNGLINSKILCMCEVGDKIFAGTDGGGINVISDMSVIKNICRSDGISSNVVLRISESSDRTGILAIASNGINYIDKDGNIKHISQFPYYDNYDIIKAKGNKLWITSSAGIYIVDESNIIKDGKFECEKLDAKKGLRSCFTANSWNYLDKNGILYLCCDDGVVSIDTNKYNKQKQSYRILLENIFVDGVLHSVDKEDINIIERNSVRVDFVPKVINYSLSDPYVSVWLEGFDKEPKVYLQHELENLTYTNLPKGEYIFHLAILDNSTEKILEQISYNFVKDKEIYDNWWFVVYMLFLLTIITAYIVWLIVGSQIEKSVKIQKKELENLRLKQEADAAVAAGEAKDKFLALMSHDIRTPINAVLGMNEMILRESKEKNVRNYAIDIKSAGNTLLTLVNMILDFSKIEEGKMDIIPVEYNTKALFNNIITGVQTRAESKGLELKIDIEESLPCGLIGDDVRVSQIISNLLTNGIKYTEKGYVQLLVKEKERREDIIVLYVEISDSGMGIRKEDMEKLFEAFQRLDEKKNRNVEGTGLGMSIVSSLLGLMDSKLEVESEYGVGSKFSFSFEQKVLDNEPIGNVLENTHHNYEEDIQNHIYAPEAKILVVDDNDMNLKVISGLLKINEINPDTVMDGFSALEKMRQKHYDIVFLDHMMPDMDGIETLHKIKAEKLDSTGTKIIILTANAVNGAKEQYLQAGFEDYLSKPIEVEKLEKLLKKYLPEELKKERPLTQEETKEDLREDLKEEVKTSDEVANVVTANVNNRKTEEDLDKARLNEICPEIDLEIGLKYCINSFIFYKKVIKTYIDGSKLEQLNEYFEQKDIDNYRVLIHALKSNSMSIGAVELSEHAKALEFACKEKDIAYVEAEHQNLMQEYGSLIERLNQYINQE